MKNNVLLMLIFWGLLIIFGLLDPFLSHYDQTYFLITTVVITLSIFAWFLADVHENNFPVGRAMKVFVLALSFIAVPIYLIRYKGWKVAMKSFGKFVLLFIFYIGILVIQDTFFLQNA